MSKSCLSAIIAYASSGLYLLSYFLLFSFLFFVSTCLCLVSLPSFSSPCLVCTCSFVFFYFLLFFFYFLLFSASKACLLFSFLFLYFLVFFFYFSFIFFCFQLRWRVSSFL